MCSKLLEPYVDTWCFVTTFYDAANIEAQRKQGDRIWDYICYGVFSPFANFYLDYACLEHRMIFWQNYNFDITGFLYWELAYWQQVSDPWTDQHTCKTFSYEVYGEGSLLYPGKKVGINGPVSSIRLEVIRDGLEDYQYLWLLEQKNRQVCCQAIMCQGADLW